MMRLLDVRGTVAFDLPRAALDVADAAAVVTPIIDDVAARGSEAALDWSLRLDGVRPAAVVVPADVLSAAADGLDPAVRNALEIATARARAVHDRQRPTPVSVEVIAGGVVTERYIPIRRAGLYVPGGKAVYPSSVVMNVVPAQAAGVEQIVVVSPPQRDNAGWPHPTVLAACALLGVAEVWAVGGAQAVALLAHGCPTAGLAPVDLVTGPGNVYVTAAKRALRGRIGIDSEAGPTEIVILADESADPQLVAADLISQAEHDPNAAAVLVTPSADLVGRVEAALEALVPQAKHADRIAAALSGPQSAAVLVDDIDHAIAVVDDYAAEHLEILTRRPSDVAARIRNAGAIFVGPFSPVSLGDYLAGSNHVLPTAGTARFSAGLSVTTFLRRVQVIGYDESALRESADHIVALANAEDLPAHGSAVRARFRPVG